MQRMGLARCGNLQHPVAIRGWRWHQRSLRLKLRAMLNNLLDYIPDGVFTVDAEWRVTFFNRAAEQITGIKRAEAVGRRCCDVFRASICENACALKQTLSTNRPVVNKVVYIIDARGQKIPISISTAALKDDGGRIVGGVESFRDLRLVEALHRELQQQNSFSDIIGRSAAMRQIFELLPKIAESESAVLIEGASGTGKELFARALHNLSRRRSKKFVAINCGAMPDNLLESELFGYKAGRFYRRAARQARPVRAGQWGHDLPGRDRRHLLGDAGPVAAGLAGTGL